MQRPFLAPTLPFDTLFTTAGDKVFKRKLKVKAAPSFQPPIKPTAPRL